MARRARGFGMRVLYVNRRARPELEAELGLTRVDKATLLAAARAELAGEPALRLDYLELTDPDLGPVPTAGPARLLVAARAGSTRLIDNLPVLLGAPA